MTAHQLPLHILVSGGADEDGVLHQAYEAPECVTFILDLGQEWSHQVRHALAVAHLRVIDRVVQEDASGEQKEIKSHNPVQAYAILYTYLLFTKCIDPIGHL